MNQNLLKKLFIFAVFINLLMGGEILAQTTTNPPIKRNSPFSPNPKKKIEATIEQTPKTDNQVTTSETQTKPNVIEDNSKPLETEQNPNVSQTTEEPKNEVEQTVETATEPQTEQNGEFESRSVAKKTLEVAKRASAVAVSPTEIYKVGLGDILLISLQNAPAKETTYFTVLKDGTIDYPLAGEMVQVLGLTAEQIEDLLKEKIKLYENPLVSVKVREHNSHSFTVLGLVERSGEKQMQREAIPLYVVRAEAIVEARANQVTIKRADQPAQIIDLKDNKSGETLIYPNDIVEFGMANTTIVGQVSQFYYIGGDIVSGGRKDYTLGLTLTQAILESGGLKKSNVKKVIIRRKNDAGLLVPNEYDLKAIKDGKSIDPAILAGDTIEIGN